jgi:DNA repair protein RecO (recombination protein O)
MYHNTKGIVLSSIKYAETSIICKIYTLEFGLQSYIVNSVRKKNGKSTYYQPLTVLDLQVSNSKQKQLHRIKEAKPHHVFNSIPFDILKSSVALFLAEVLNKCLKEEEKNEHLFLFLEKAIVDMDESPYNSQFHLSFLIILSKHLGFCPDFNYQNQLYFDMLNGTFVHELPTHSNYLSNPKELIMLIQGHKLKNDEKRIVLSQLIMYYQVHVEGFGKIKSVEVLETILNK